MSDSGVVRFLPSNIYFYTHSEGSQLDRDLATAINDASGRWDDPDYFVRIVLGSLCAPYNGSVTGAGIGTGSNIDSNYDEIIVDVAHMTVNGMPYAQFLEDK